MFANVLSWLQRGHTNTVVILHKSAWMMSLFAMESAKNNCSTATIPCKQARMDSMFDHKQDCDEPLHVWPQQRSRQTIPWLSATMNATINLTIGELVQPHNFRWKLGPPTLQGIACYKQLPHYAWKKAPTYTIILLLIVAVLLRLGDDTHLTTQEQNPYRSRVQWVRVDSTISQLLLTRTLVFVTLSFDW